MLLSGKQKMSKKWPKEYFASDKDCQNKKYRRCSPVKARRMGVLGVRTWSGKFDNSAKIIIKPTLSPIV